MEIMLWRVSHISIPQPPYDSLSLVTLREEVSPALPRSGDILVISAAAVARSVPWQQPAVSLADKMYRAR
jgi:hypothetical protein